MQPEQFGPGPYGYEILGTNMQPEQFGPDPHGFEILGKG